MLQNKKTEEKAFVWKLNVIVSNIEIKLHGIHIIHTLSATFLKFFAAIEGRKEYGKSIALRSFRSLHSINLNGYHYEFLKQPRLNFK